MIPDLKNMPAEVQPKGPCTYCGEPIQLIVNYAEFTNPDGVSIEYVCQAGHSVVVRGPLVQPVQPVRQSGTYLPCVECDPRPDGTTVLQVRCFMCGKKCRSESLSGLEEELMKHHWSQRLPDSSSLATRDIQAGALFCEPCARRVKRETVHFKMQSAAISLKSEEYLGEPRPEVEIEQLNTDLLDQVEREIGRVNVGEREAQ